MLRWLAPRCNGFKSHEVTEASRLYIRRHRTVDWSVLRWRIKSHEVASGQADSRASMWCNLKVRREPHRRRFTHLGYMQSKENHIRTIKPSIIPEFIRALGLDKKYMKRIRGHNRPKVAVHILYPLSIYLSIQYDHSIYASLVYNAKQHCKRCFV